MRAIRELLRDRRRSQRGSVLSGVLIMTAFIAIISGALLTELSTNFLLSHALVNRVANEATDSSAMELSLSSLQTTALNAPCPALAPATINNLTSSPTYINCFPTVDLKSPQFTQIASTSGSFTVDGAHVQVGSLNDYVVGDSAGNVFDYRFGSTAWRWQLDLDSATSAPPLVIARPGYSGQFLDVIPLAAGPGCPASKACLDVRIDNNSSGTPVQQCLVTTSAGGPVTAQPAASSAAGLIYFGDGATLEAADISSSPCPTKSTVAIPGNQAVVAGPVAFRCTGGCGQTIDFIYAVVSDAASSRLIEFTYGGNKGLEVTGTWALPWANVSGIATQGTSLPTNIAISFGGGGVALYGLTPGGAAFVNSQIVGGGIADAPFWCGSCGLFGVGAGNGGLYLFNGSLGLVGSYVGTGSAIDTTPSVDGAGNWYYGASDGYVHEIHRQNGGPFTEVKRYGGMGAVGSSVQIGGCPTGICVYLGTLTSRLYVVRLDARDAALSACISSAAPKPTCLWANAEVGDALSPQTVHVKGWSYYSG